jgi:hypothetical protein
MPIAAIRASDNHVAWRESMNLAKRLPARLRYRTDISTSHNATTRMLSGKRNMSKGKLPRHSSATTDSTATPPAMNTADMERELFIDVNIAITGDKVSLIFRKTDYSTSKI